MTPIRTSFPAEGYAARLIAYFPRAGRPAA